MMPLDQLFDKPLGRIAMKGGNQSLNEHLPSHNTGGLGKNDKIKRAPWLPE